MPTSGHVVRSVLTLGAGQAVTWIAGAALTVLMPRFLGDVYLGKLAFALAATQLVGILVDLGTGTYVTKEVAREPGRAASLLTNAILVRLPLSLIAVAVAIIGVNLGDSDELTRQLVYLLCIGTVISALSGVIGSMLQGLQWMTLLTISSVGPKLGYAVLAIGFLLAGGGPIAVAAASIVSACLWLVICMPPLLRHVQLIARPDWRTVKAIVVGGSPFLLWQASHNVYGQIDVVLLSYLAHDAVVGWYSAAYRIVSIPQFLPWILITVLFPSLSAVAADRESFNGTVRRAVQIITLLVLPMSLGILLIPDKIIQLLGYPDAFMSSVIPIMLLACHIPLVGIGMVVGTALNARDHQRQWALVAVAAAVVNPLANLVAIPLTQNAYGNGAIGAAFVTLLTEVGSVGLGLWLLRDGTLDRATFLHLGKSLCAGAIMAVSVIVTRDLPIAVTTATGAVVYGACCLAIGTLSLGELNEVRLQLSRRAVVANA